jgi:hypothetical protein
MTRLVLALFLLAGCVNGDDENNCLPISCAGCCGADGTCHSGTEAKTCGQNAMLCVDCATMALTCDLPTRTCH